MAQRRMFSLSVTDSDEFVDMPGSSQALYFHFGMHADDDGFVASPKRLMRSVGAATDDLKLLVTKGFLIDFGATALVIRDWRVNNYLQNDRLTPTQFTNELNLLAQDDNGRYYRMDNGEATAFVSSGGALYPLRVDQEDGSRVTVRINKKSGSRNRVEPYSLGYLEMMDTTRIHDVSSSEAQVSVVKVREVKGSVDQSSTAENREGATPSPKDLPERQQNSVPHDEPGLEMVLRRNELNVTRTVAELTKLNDGKALPSEIMKQIHQMAGRLSRR